jgi:hypothetical protein
MKSENRILSYLKQQKKCVTCETPIPYESRYNTFCNNSCSISYTNRFKRKPVKQCLVCDNFVKQHGKTFCSQSCSAKHVSVSHHANIELGLVSDRSTLKKYLKYHNTDCRCMMCGNTEWLEQPIPLELDHIDGDASNNLPINLRLICPNCHALTPTWKGRNRGSGRKTRNLPVS